MKRFKIGDAAILIRVADMHPSLDPYIGLVCFVEELDHGAIGRIWDYRIKLCDNHPAWVMDKCLKPIEPPVEDVFSEESEELEA